MGRANINWLRAGFFPDLAEDIRDQDDVASLIPGASASITDYPIWIRVLVSFFIHLEYLIISLFTIGLSVMLAALGFNLPTRPNSIFWMLIGVAGVLYFVDSVLETVRSSLINAVVTGLGRRLIILVLGVDVIAIRSQGPALTAKTLLFSRRVHVFMVSALDYLRPKKERALKIRPEHSRGTVRETLRIAVIDDEGNPVPGATVELGHKEGRTDSNGKVELTPQEAGLASIVAKKADDTSNTYQPTEMGISIEKKNVGLRFVEVPHRVEAESEIELQVVDESGKPIEDVEIEIDGECVPPTDSRGYTMAHFPEPGTFAIRAQKPETGDKVFEPTYAIIEVEPKETQIEEYPDAAQAEKRVEPKVVQFEEYPEVVQSGERAHFRVTDRKGNPVSDATIRTSRGHSIQTDDEGWASIIFDEPGLARVSVKASESGETGAEYVAEISVRVEVEFLFWL